MKINFTTLDSIIDYNIKNNKDVDEDIIIYLDKEDIISLDEWAGGDNKNKLTDNYYAHLYYRHYNIYIVEI